LGREGGEAVGLSIRTVRLHRAACLGRYFFSVL